LNCTCLSKCKNQGSPGISCTTEEAKEQIANSLPVTPQTLDYNGFNEQNRGESNETNTAEKAEKDTAQFTSEEDPGEETEEKERPTESLIGALLGAVTLEADIKLMSVYGDYIHQNDGTHLDGGIADYSDGQNSSSCQLNATRHQEVQLADNLFECLPWSWKEYGVGSGIPNGLSFFKW
jgi:hypothetical protein